MILENATDLESLIKISDEGYWASCSKFFFQSFLDERVNNTPAEFFLIFTLSESRIPSVVSSTKSIQVDFPSARTISPIFLASFFVLKGCLHKHIIQFPQVRHVRGVAQVILLPMVMNVDGRKIAQIGSIF